ncbi:hypothetical protein HETIRDRAFT_181235 [Heterobasidion irregulare TC 32-1]|uniref:Glycopeptide n=1 Tax=Heterobasidion irregulare (strain TC 32-1) TaxID=747525 RepID=W4K5E5_HETIT|nr:uncharacterized protein HETIRDRAFT_181235 [Heterobasidion irregulare TC 32-1]ETW80969.1 hypothetical protein HETIRDRAFT_181235 [Heterobasidion irregulare TC 32-1]
MAPTFVYIVIVAIAASAAAVNAESHTIRFDNQCGRGTPQLIFGGHVVSNGSDWTSSGPASSGIAYLQTGECLFNGEHCALLEMTLGNPTCPGCGSSTDISLIPPHALNVPVSFRQVYFNGCDGQGAACNSANCNTAFFVSDDNQVQVACQEDNVDLLITFCGNGATSSATSEPANAPTPSSFPTSSPASPHESPEPTSSSIVHTSIVESSSTAAVSLVTTGPSNGPSTVPSPTALSETSGTSSSTVSPKTCSVFHTSIAESSSTAAHSRRSKARVAHVQMNAARVHA